MKDISGSKGVEVGSQNGKSFTSSSDLRQYFELLSLLKISASSPFFVRFSAAVSFIFNRLLTSFLSFVKESISKVRKMESYSILLLSSGQGVVTKIISLIECDKLIERCDNLLYLSVN